LHGKVSAKCRPAEAGGGGNCCGEQAQLQKGGAHPAQILQRAQGASGSPINKVLIFIPAPKQQRFLSAHYHHKASIARKSICLVHTCGGIMRTAV